MIGRFVALMALVCTVIGCSSTPVVKQPEPPRLVKAVWSGEAGGLCVQLNRSLTTEGTNELLGGVELRLTGPTLPRPIFAIPSDRGGLCFRIADTPAQFQRIRPGQVKIDALIGGTLYELDSRLMDQATLDQLFEWSLARSRGRIGTGGPGGSATIEFSTEAGPVRAGGRTVLRARATSTGTRPLYRLRARVEPPKNSGIDPVVFDFGMLDPGETLELDEKLSVPRRTRLDTAELAVKPTERFGATIDAPESVYVAIDPLELPALEATLRALPDRHGRVVSDPKSELYRPGDDVHLICDVRNFGQTTLRGGIARLRLPVENTASVRIGRAIVGDLPPAASGRAHIWLVVTAPLGSGPIPVIVEIVDSDLGVVAEATTLLRMEPEDTENVASDGSAVTPSD